MANDTQITLIGNLTADPELRFSPSGSAVANLTIASTPSSFDKQTNAFKDGETLFMRCSIWRDAAEHVAESLTKGMRVIAQGRLKSRTYTTKEGESRTVQELELDEIGPSLRYATAKVTRAQSNNPQNGTQSQGAGFGGQQQSQAPAQGNWGQPAPAQQQQAWGNGSNQQNPNDQPF